MHREQNGASTVEYALLLAGIATVIMAAVFVLGGGVQSLFGDTCDSISQEVNSSTC